MFVQLYGSVPTVLSTTPSGQTVVLLFVPFEKSATEWLRTVPAEAGGVEKGGMISINTMNIAAVRAMLRTLIYPAPRTDANADPPVLSGSDLNASITDIHSRPAFFDGREASAPVSGRERLVIGRGHRMHTIQRTFGTGPMACHRLV